MRKPRQMLFSTATLGVVITVFLSFGNCETDMPVKDCIAMGEGGNAEKGSVHLKMTPSIEEKENGTCVLDTQEEYTINLTYTSSTNAPNGTLYVYAIVVIEAKDNTSTSTMILINAKTTSEFTQKKQGFEETKLRLSGMIKEVKDAFSPDAAFTEILKGIKVWLYTKIFDGNNQVVVCRQMEIRLKGEDPTVGNTGTPVEVPEKATVNATTSSS